MKLYRSIDVWKRFEDGRVACYRCFETLPDRRYCVQSLDFFDPAKKGSEESMFDQQRLELLADTAPDERSPTFLSLEEAIEAHNKEFAE